MNDHYLKEYQPFISNNFEDIEIALAYLYHKIPDHLTNEKIQALLLYQMIKTVREKWNYYCNEFPDYNDFM